MQLHFKKQVELGIFISLAIIFFLVDALVSDFAIPIKVGLANIVIIYLIEHFSFLDALFVNIVKVILGNLLIGRLFSPVFFFSLAGGIVAVIAMYCIIVIFKNNIGYLGIAITGAVAHNISQFLVFWAISGMNKVIFYALPLVIGLSIFFGLIVGILSYYINKRSKFLYKLKESEA